MASAPMENDIIEMLNESIKIADNKPIYSYPDYYNIFPCYIAPYLNEKGEKITKFPLKWEKLMTEKYPKAKLLQDIQTIDKKGKYNSLAVMGGAISNNLIILDLDLNKGYNSEEFFNLIIKHLPILKNTLTEKSYRGGYHFHLLVDDMSCYESLEIGTLKDTIFGSCCHEVGIRGERKLTFIWSGNNYEVINEVPPLKISNEQFLEIIESISITEVSDIITPEIKKETVKKLTIGSTTTKKDNKFKKLRTPFRDLMNGFVEIHKYAETTKKDELNYWRGIYFEAELLGKLTFEETAKILSKNQKGEFKPTETKDQIKDVKKRYEEFKGYYETWFCTKKGWEAHFPNYPYEEFKKPKKKKKKKEKEEELSYYDLRDLIINQNLNNTTNIITIRENEELCRRSNGVYIRKAKSFINTQITHLLEGIGIAYSPYKKKAIVELIKTQTYHSIKEFDTNEALLNVKNGVFNLNTGKFEKHNTSDLFFIQIPVEYNPNATCPKIEKFMSEIFKKEDIDLIYEFIGLCLTPEMRFQKALMLYGNGNNGKTTFLNLLVSLIGKTNKSSVPLSQLNKTFEGAKLEGKLINLVSDLDSSKMAIRFFKMYVGNELSITIDRKFKEPYDTKPTAKLLYSCNAIFPEIPKDTDKGFFRKWILIECPNEFDEKENLEMLDSLITEKELSGFLNKTIEGLYRLLKRGRFEAKYTNWFDVRKIWTEKANPFNSFIDDNEEYKKGDYIDAIHDKSNQFWETKKYTLKLYNKYLEEKINVPSIQQSLLTRIINNSSNFSLASRKINGKREEVYTGFKLQEKKSSYKNL